MSRPPMPRQQSSQCSPEEHEQANPFVHSLHLTWLDKLQIAFMTVTVLPLRIIFIFTSLVIGWFLARIALIGRTNEEVHPMTGWRNFMRPVVVFFARGVFFGGGFHWVTEKGKRASHLDAPILTGAPHSSYFDALVITYLDLCSVVAKSDVELIPFFGILTRFTQPVFVKREDPNSRANTVKEVVRRAQSGEWPQVILFPEGTCTNRECLITFKPGAFYASVPVQPVLIKYNNRLDTVTWTWEGMGAFRVLWYTLCQFNNKLELEYLPVYTPNEEEKKDANLYGRNVRAVMAKALGVPETDHTYEDIRLMNYATRLKYPAASCLVQLSKLMRKLGINVEKMSILLERVTSIAQHAVERVGVDEFARHLDMSLTDQPKDKPVTAMFNLYDKDGSGSIDFREFVIALSMLAMPKNKEDTLQLAFQLYDDGTKGYTTVADFSIIMQTIFGMNKAESPRIFKLADTDEDGKITYEEFKAYGELRPEYAGVFTGRSRTSSTSQSNGSLISMLSCESGQPDNNGNAEKQKTL